MFVDMATASYALIETQLPTGTTLRAHVMRARRRGLGWRAIADDIAEQTGVVVSYETLRRWFPEVVASPTATAFNRGARAS